MAKILVLDGDADFCRSLAHIVGQAGHHVVAIHGLREGQAIAAAGRFDVIFLAEELPDGGGLERTAELHNGPGHPEVIITTRIKDEAKMEAAMREGAWDYLEKPLSAQSLLLPLTRALQYREAHSSVDSRGGAERAGILGSSPAIMAALKAMAQAAASESSVLITGETGTGKELFARAIHQNSRRSGGRLVVVDCAALPENLVGSVLFGHQRGAFTGADRSTTGMIREAHGGTLFLDEVGELPLELQKAFLRVLQERRFRPLGGSHEVTSDFRLVAATNRDLSQMARQGLFRPELLYRLRSFTIDLPPLRQRQGDVIGLALFRLTQLTSGGGPHTKGLSPEFIAALNAYHWPGNVRELFNALERAVVAAGDSPVLYPTHLPIEMRVNLARSSLQSAGSPPPRPGREPGGDFSGPAGAAEPGWGEILRSDQPLPNWREFRGRALAAAGRAYLDRVMAACQGDMARAQEITGLSRARLYALFKELDMPRRRWRRRDPGYPDAGR